MRRLVYTLVIFISIPCFSQEVAITSDKWQAFNVPTNTDTLQSYNRSLEEWTVFLKANIVYATNDRRAISDTLPFEIISPENDRFLFKGRRTVLGVDDGYLVGFYHGEWSGSMFWFSKDGKLNYRISEHEIVQFKKRGNKIYAIEGLAHMSLSEGSMVEIKKMANKWIASPYLKLPSAPYAIDLDSNNNFVIISSHSLLKVDVKAKIHVLVKDAFWDGLYPNSLLIKDDIAFMGMRKGVFKYNLNTHKEEWLILQ